MKEYRSIKLWLSTYRVLKVLAAQRGETLAALIDRLARQEEEGRKATARDDRAEGR